MFDADDLALVLADVRQLPDSGDVSDGPQPVAHPQARVHRDSALVHGNTHRLQPDAIDARAAAGGDQQAVAAKLAPVVELQNIVVALAPSRGRICAERQRRFPRGETLRRALRPARPARGKADARTSPRW